MATWQQFADARPDMATRGHAHLSIPVAYLATVRKDGAPRLHPLSPIFAGGRLFVAIGPQSPRRFDLARDGRYSLHALPPLLGPEYDEFEFNVTGRAQRHIDAGTLALVNKAEAARGRPAITPDYWLFELHIEAALTSVWKHNMQQVDGQWRPVLGADPPSVSRETWREDDPGTLSP